MLVPSTGADHPATVQPQRDVGVHAGVAACAAACSPGSQERSPVKPLPPKTPAPTLADAAPPQPLPGVGSPSSALTVALRHGAAGAAGELSAPVTAAAAAVRDPGADEGTLQDEVLLFTVPAAALDPALLVHSPGSSQEPGHALLSAGAEAAAAARSAGGCSTQPTAASTSPGYSAGGGSSGGWDGDGEGTPRAAAAVGDLMSPSIDGFSLADLLQVREGSSWGPLARQHVGCGICLPPVPRISIALACLLRFNTRAPTDPPVLPRMVPAGSRPAASARTRHGSQPGVSPGRVSSRPAHPAMHGGWQQRQPGSFPPPPLLPAPAWLLAPATLAVRPARPGAPARHGAAAAAAAPAGAARRAGGMPGSAAGAPAAAGHAAGRAAAVIVAALRPATWPGTSHAALGGAAPAWPFACTWHRPAAPRRRTHARAWRPGAA